jgi:hypothetical protein
MSGKGAFFALGIPTLKRASVEKNSASSAGINEPIAGGGAPCGTSGGFEKNSCVSNVIKSLSMVESPSR